jgi:hypothetical protein
MSTSRHYSAASAPPNVAREEKWITPAHGHGRLRPWQKGQSGYVPGTAHRYNETVALARQHSLDAVRALIRLLNDADGRIVSVAACALLDRGWGRVTREAALDEPQEAVLDLSALSNRELQILVDLCDSGRLRAVEPQSSLLQIEGAANGPSGVRE